MGPDRYLCFYWALFNVLCISYGRLGFFSSGLLGKQPIFHKESANTLARKDVPVVFSLYIFRKHVFFAKTSLNTLIFLVAVVQLCYLV